MGLLVSAIKFATKGISYAKRGAKVYLPTVFGEGNKVLETAYKNNITTKNPFTKDFWNGLWKGTKDAGKAAEAYSAKVGGNKAFLSNMWKSLKTLPTTCATGAKAGARAAKIAGKNTFLGAAKGLFKKIGKKMPVIGSLLILGFEIPNIIKATKEKGLVQGVKETLKAGAKLGGMTMGAAIGGALGGPIGALVGAVIGDLAAGKVVGKSYSEKVAEQQEQEQTIVNNGQAASDYTTSPFTPKCSSEELMKLQRTLYSQNDIFANPSGLNYSA